MKKTQDIVLLLDCSTSMKGKPFEDVKKAIKSLQYKLNTYNDRIFKIHIIAFDNMARYVKISNIDKLYAYGNTNLADAYDSLAQLYRNDNFKSKPIVILLCDGEPNYLDHRPYLAMLKNMQAFRNSTKLAFAYNNCPASAMSVLKDFTGQYKNVFRENSSKIIKYIIGDIVSKQCNYSKYRKGVSYGKNS